MCTSIVSNGKKTFVGWNLDLLDMEYRVAPSSEGVYIEIYDKTEGWLPLFGANKRGDFVGMPTCWPNAKTSEPVSGAVNVINLDIDLLLMKLTFSEVKSIVESKNICSVTGLTFMSALSDKDGNVLHVIPGQGYKYYEKPRYKVLTNFSPFKTDSETHPWCGFDRYDKANEILENASPDLDVKDCFALLKEVSQSACPTVVSMVFDVSALTVYWCEQRRWNEIKKQVLK